MEQSYSEQLDAVERLHNVVVEVSDASGGTHVYTYTEDDDRIGFDFNTMNPAVGDVLAVAAAIDALRVMANKRPRVGRPEVSR